MNQAITPRFVPAALGALVIGFALQLIMQGLINQDDVLILDDGKSFELAIASPPPPPPRAVQRAEVRPPEPIKRPDIAGLTQITPVPFVKPAPTGVPMDVRAPMTGLPTGHGWAGLNPVLPDLAARARSPIRPIFPDRARRNDKSGNVIVAFTVLADGTARDIEIENVDPRGFGFEQAVRRALRGTVFVPATKDGQAVDSRLRQSFVFDLERH